MQVSELDAIVKEAESQSRLTGYVAANLFDRVVNAVRSLLPQTIDDAPVDGTYVLVKDGRGHWYQCQQFSGTWNAVDGTVVDDPVAFVPLPGGAAVTPQFVAAAEIESNTTIATARCGKCLGSGYVNKNGSDYRCRICNVTSRKAVRRDVS